MKCEGWQLAGGEKCARRVRASQLHSLIHVFSGLSDLFQCMRTAFVRFLSAWSTWSRRIAFVMTQFYHRQGEPSSSISPRVKCGEENFYRVAHKSQVSHFPFPANSTRISLKSPTSYKPFIYTFSFIPNSQEKKPSCLLWLCACAMFSFIKSTLAFRMKLFFRTFFLVTFDVELMRLGNDLKVA